MYGQNYGRKWERMPRWRKGKVVTWKTTRTLLHWPWGQGIQGDHQECSQEIGNTSGSRYALQDKQEQSESAKPMRSKSKLACILEASESRKDCVWKNLCRIIMKTILQEKRQFTAALQFGSQNYSYVPSHENSRSKGSSGQGMGKIGENFGVEPDKSQK